MKREEIIKELEYASCIALTMLRIKWAKRDGKDYSQLRSELKGMILAASLFLKLGITYDEADEIIEEMINQEE